MSVLEYKTRVSYDEIDGNGTLSFRGAMSMMQEAAIIHSDQVGYSFRTTSATHVVWMLLQWRIRFTGDAHWNEEIIVRTWPRTMERATSERDFEIVSADGRQIAIAESLWVLVNADTGRIARISADMFSAYDLEDRKVFAEEAPAIPEGNGEVAFSGRILKRDVDTNLHANNRAYLDYAMEALSDAAMQRNYRELVIRYKDQLLPDQKFRCCSRDLEDCSIVDICAENTVHIHATVLLKS